MLPGTFGKKEVSAMSVPDAIEACMEVSAWFEQSNTRFETCISDHVRLNRGFQISILSSLLRIIVSTRIMFHGVETANGMCLSLSQRKTSPILTPNASLA